MSLYSHILPVLDFGAKSSSQKNGLCVWANAWLFQLHQLLQGRHCLSLPTFPWPQLSMHAAIWHVTRSSPPALLACSCASCRRKATVKLPQLQFVSPVYLFDTRVGDHWSSAFPSWSSQHGDGGQHLKWSAKGKISIYPGWELLVIEEVCSWGGGGGEKGAKKTKEGS